MFISNNSGHNWTQLAEYFNTTISTWTRVQLDLSAYVGLSNILIKFEVQPYSGYSGAEGWYIDDVMIANASADISVSPTSKDYGSVNVGSQSPAEVFTVTNKGIADLVISTLSLTGANAISILKERVANSHSNTSETLYKGRSYTATGSNVKSLSPVSAVHSKIGNVLQPLRYSDNTYVKMFPGDIITLTFPYVPLQDEERDFIFVGEGFYVPLIPR